VPKNSLYLQLVLARNACMIYMDEWRKGGREGERPWRGSSGGDTNENSIKQQTRKIQTSIDALLRAADKS